MENIEDLNTVLTRLILRDMVINTIHVNFGWKYEKSR